MSHSIQLNLDKQIDIVSSPGLFTPEEIKHIATYRGMSEQDAQALLQYNILTFSQLSTLTGISESQLRNASVPTVKRDGKATCWLEVCNPFPDEKKGKLFVHVNDKCVEFIKRAVYLL
jgi:hypothetical protein